MMAGAGSGLCFFHSTYIRLAGAEGAGAERGAAAAAEAAEAAAGSEATADGRDAAVASASLEPEADAPPPATPRRCCGCRLCC